MFSKSKQSWWWLLAAGLTTLLKLWLTRGQSVSAIGPAIHDDRLFLELAEHLIRGEWLGVYDQFTLAKGPAYSLWVATVYFTGIPLRLAEQIFYAGACALTVRALSPQLRTAAIHFLAYSLLLWNPMSFEGPTLTRIVRQNIYTPLGLLVFAGFIALILRREQPLRRLVPWAILAGLSAGCFWLTREESVWLVPGVAVLAGVLLVGIIQDRSTWRRIAGALGITALAAMLPVFTVSCINRAHYGWFGTVEFRASAFKDAYGALARIEAGDPLPMVPVTRQAREAAYAVSPAFAELRPFLEGPVGDRWAEKQLFPAADRQIRGGWFMWALRDAVAEAGHAGNAGDALAFYRRMADEINRACDRGDLKAGPLRSGFLPKWQPGLGGELANAGIDYAMYFGTFQSFTAYPAGSLGSPDSLQLFHSMTHERIGPVEGEQPSPEFPARRERLDWLNRIGDLTARLLALLCLASLALWPVRLVQALRARQLPFPLALATAAIAAGGAYLAVNVIVHVTSFPNVTPSAMAAAYPLLILFAIAMGLDCSVAWSESKVADGGTVANDRPRRTESLAWAIGAGLLAFALQLRWISLYGSDTPFHAQWDFRVAGFLAPHEGNLPLWSHLFTWLEIAVTGHWDLLVQQTIHALLYAGFTGLVVRWVSQSFDWRAALGAGVLLAGGAALGCDWENLSSGFQSPVPLALLLLFIHVHGSLSHAAGSRLWWFAQAIGIAALFTLSSLWLAPVAVAATLAWTELRGDKRRWLGLIVAAIGLGLVIFLRQHSAPNNPFPPGAPQWAAFLGAVVHYWGWPGTWPAAAVLFNLPWMAFAFQLRGRTETSASDRIVLALGLWSLLQGAALAIQHGGAVDFVWPRFGGLLAIGVLANGLAMFRLLTARANGPRRAVVTFALVWAGMAVHDARELASSQPAVNFREHAREWADLRRDAIRDYLASHDPQVLAKSPLPDIFSHDPTLVARLLDQPGFAAQLPASVNPASTPDAAGRAARFLQRNWLPIALGAGAILAVGAAFTVAPLVRSFEFARDPLRPWLVAAGGTIALILLCQWRHPFEFDAANRWTRLVALPGSLADVRFEIVGPSPFANDRLVGAAGIAPEIFRNHFAGTRPDGPGFTGVVRSSVFKLNSPWLVVPAAGFPVGNGNALRLQVEDDKGAMVADLWCPGPNPPDVKYWAVDVRKYQGQPARLWLYDGRTDTEAWVAAAPPIASPSPRLAEALQDALALERVGDGRAPLLAIAMLSGAWLAVAAGRAIAGKRRPTQPAAATGPGAS